MGAGRESGRPLSAAWHAGGPDPRRQSLRHGDGRRWNEAGVDLNRNALKLSEPFEGLVDRRRDVEDAHAELASC